MRLALLLTVAVAACTGPPLATGPDAPVSPRSLAALADSLAEGDRASAVRRALVRAGVTPLGDYSLRTPSPTFTSGALVGGFVPGEHPVGRPELVVVAVPLASAAAPALVEAARVVVERSRWSGVPDRTLLVAFHDDAGPGQPLAAGLWPRALVRAVVTVGAAPDSVAGVPVISVPVADGPALAAALLDATLAAARYAPPAPSDSTAR